MLIPQPLWRRGRHLPLKQEAKPFGIVHTVSVTSKENTWCLNVCLFVVFLLLLLFTFTVFIPWWHVETALYYIVRWRNIVSALLRIECCLQSPECIYFQLPSYLEIGLEKVSFNCDGSYRHWNFIFWSEAFIDCTAQWWFWPFWFCFLYLRLGRRFNSGWSVAFICLRKRLYVYSLTKKKELQAHTGVSLLSTCGEKWLFIPCVWSPFCLAWTWELIASLLFHVC